MADIDTLSIKIEANAAGAIRSVNKLSKALSALNKAIDGLNVDKINQFCDAVYGLAGAAEALSGSADAVKVLARAYKDLEKSGYSVNKAKEATDSLANSTGGLNSASANMNTLVVAGNSLASMFERLTSVAAGLKEYEQVTQTFESISGASQKLIGQMSVFDTTFREITEPMNELMVVGNSVVAILERMAVALSGLNQYMNVAGVFAALGGGSQKLIEDMGIIDTTFREINEPAEEATESINNFADAVNDAANSASNGGGDIGKKAADSIESFITPSKKAKIAIDSLKAGLNGFTGTIAKAGSVFGVFAKKTFTTVTGLKGMKKMADSLRGSASKLAKEFGRVAKMLKLMITRMILRQVISNVTDGFKNLAQYSSTFDASLSLLWNSFRQLGNSVAAAVSPLLNALAPALNTIIQLCIQAVNAINQLLSALTGLSSWTKAKKLTDSYAKSLDKSNKAAKALKKTVLGFDELNQLHDNNSGSGGGTSPLDMFEEDEIDPKWKNFADWLKEMWDNWDFSPLGKLLGEKLLEALNSIPWDKIKQKARQIGSSIATLIGGFVQVEGLGEAIGRTLAEALNTGFEFLNEFVHKLPWKSVGKFIGETFNGFFENIDWALIKDTVVTGFQGLADSLIQFILTFKWDNLSKAISNSVNTLATGITEFFNRPMYDDRGFLMNGTWAERLGVEIGSQLRQAIEQIDWKMVGDAIGSIIQAALDFCASTLDQLDTKQIEQAIQDLLEGFWEKVNKEQLGKVIGAVIVAATLKGIASLGKTALSIVFAEKIKSIVAGSAAKQVTTAAGTSIGSYVVAGILSYWGGSNVGSLIGAGLASIFNPKDISLYMDYVGILGPFKLIKDNIIAIVDAIGMAWSALWKHIATEAKENFKLIGIDLDEIFGKFSFNTEPLDNFKKKLADLSGEIKKTSDNTKDASERFLEAHTHSTSFSEALDKLKSSSDNASSSFSKVVEEITKSASKTDTATNSFGNFVSAMNDVDTGAKEMERQTTTSFGAMYEQSKKLTSDMPVEFNTAKDSTNKSLDEMCEAMDKVKSGMTEDKWTFKGVIDGLKNTFKDALKGAAEWWNKFSEQINGEHSIFGKQLTIKLPKIQGFARGGFPEDGLFMANHGEMVGKFSNGRTAVANNEQITQGIAQAVFNAISSANSMNGGSERYINNTIYIGDEEVARAVTRGQEKIGRRYSPTMA